MKEIPENKAGKAEARRRQVLERRRQILDKYLLHCPECNGAAIYIISSLFAKCLDCKHVWKMVKRGK